MNLAARDTQALLRDIQRRKGTGVQLSSWVETNEGPRLLSDLIQECRGAIDPAYEILGRLR